MKLALSLIAVAASVTAADWPQYRGPNGDGTTPDKVSTTWPSGGPKPLWKVQGGTGFSSFAIAGARCFTIEGLDGKEVLVARAVQDGKQIWKAEIGVTEYGNPGGNDGASSNNGGDGPRSTPTLVGNLVLATSSDLVVYAFD